MIESVLSHPVAACFVMAFAAPLASVALNGLALVWRAGRAYRRGLDAAAAWHAAQAEQCSAVDHVALAIWHQHAARRIAQL